MKNQKMLDKASALLPRLVETPIEAVRTVIPVRDKTGRISMTETESFKTIALKKGDRMVLDFGDHQVGYLSLELDALGSHADAPVWLRLHFAENPVELFEKAGDYNGWVCSSWIEEEQIHVDIIPSMVDLPRRYAFRYVEIEVIDISSKFRLLVKNAVCTAVSSARDEDLQEYKTQDPVLKKLDKIGCRTLHNCMQLVFEDGPKRDRRLWMGDLRIQALVNYETYRMNDLVKVCLYLFAALPLENGQIAGCLYLDPRPEADDVKMFDYSLFFICTLRDYYRETGDMEALAELWPTALSQIFLAENRLTEEDLICDSEEPGWCFTDWNLGLNKQGAAQGVFLYALRAAVELAGILKEKNIADKLTDIYQSCKRAANERLWDEEEACYISGGERQISIATQVWMVLGGAVEGEAAGQLLRRITEDPQALQMVSPYMYHNYIDALIKAGEKELALEKIRDYWGGMALQGADTFWELYNPQNPAESPYGGTIVNSYCHAWSCGPSYFLRKYWHD